MITQLAATYDRVFSQRLHVSVRHAFVWLAIGLFIMQLSLLSLHRLFPQLHLPSHLLPANYFDSFSLPFSVILLYELFLMLVALPNTVTAFVIRQFEVASLIMVRQVFKMLEYLPSGQNPHALPFFLQLSAAMLGSLALYTCTAITRSLWQTHLSHLDGEPDRLLNIKKGLTIVLCVGLAGALAVQVGRSIGLDSLGHLGVSSLSYITYGLVSVDILLLLVSIMYIHSFHILYQYSALILCAVIVQLAITFAAPLNVLVILGSLVFFGLTVASQHLTRRSGVVLEVES